MNNVRIEIGRWASSFKYEKRPPVFVGRPLKLMSISAVLLKLRIKHNL